MKKMMAIAFAAMWLTACSDNNAETTNAETTTTTTSTTTYTPAEGDVIYRDNQVSVWRSGEWVVADDDVRLDDGIVVNRNGRVIRNDREIILKDGETVNRSGKFFDRTGNSIDNAWDATKEGAKDAGRAIEKAANKVGEKAKDVVDGDDKKQ